MEDREDKGLTNTHYKYIKKTAQVTILILSIVALGVLAAIGTLIANRGKEQAMYISPMRDAIDAGLIATAQAVEHYEIARYGTMCRWAELIGQKQAAKLLKETLAEEEATDVSLTKIAEGSANQAALKAA